jgi:predicted amidophosphoribosyltransferase
MPADRRQSSASPAICDCCGQWAPPGEYRCQGCVFHVARCHRHRKGLARFGARLDDLADVVGRWRRVGYGDGGAT